MSYDLSIEEMDAIDAQQAAQGPQQVSTPDGGYHLSIAEMDAIDAQQGQQQQESPQEPSLPWSRYVDAFASGAVTEPIRGATNALLELVGPMSKNAQTGKIEPKRLSADTFYNALGIPQMNPATQTSTGENFANLGGSLATGLALPMSKALTLPAVAKGFFPTVGKALGQGAVAGAATAPLFMPDTSLPQALATGGALGAAGNALISGVPAAVRSFRKMGATASPKEIKQAIQDAKMANVQLPLGELIESPRVKQIQSSFLAKTPLSSMSTIYHNLGKDLNNNVINITEKLSPGTPVANVSSNLVNNLTDSVLRGRSNTREKYEQLSNLADETGQKVDPTKAYKNLQDLLKKYDSSYKLFPSLKAFSNSSKAEDFFNRIKNMDLESTPVYSKVLDKSGNPSVLRYEEPIVKGTFGEARATDELLNELIENSISEKDFKSVSILKKVKGELNDAIQSSVEKSGNQELINLWGEAKDTYKKQVVPYLHPDILQFTLGKKDPSQIVPTFIKSTRNSVENKEQVERLSSLLPQKLKKEAGLLFLTKGKDIDYEDAPRILKNLFGMGKTARKEFIPQDILDKFSATMRTGKRLGAQREQMYLPKTGNEGANQSGLLASLGAIAAAAKGGHALMGDLGGIGGAIGATLLPGLLTKSAMNPKRVQKVLKALTTTKNK